MPDEVHAKDESKYEPHPEGVKIGLCVDSIDLGESVMDFAGQTPYIGRKVALAFRTGAVNTKTGELIDQAKEFTLSMSPKGNLRKFLEAWRGKAYTDEQAKAGVPLHKLVGQYALLTIAHKESARGRTFGDIISISGVPQEMKGALPQYAPYERQKYWADKKELAAKAVREFRAKQATENRSAGSAGGDFESAHAALDDDDDLLF